MSTGLSSISLAVLTRSPRVPCVLQHETDFVHADVGEHESPADPAAQRDDQRVDVVAGVLRLGEPATTESEIRSSTRLSYPVVTCRIRTGVLDG